MKSLKYISLLALVLSFVSLTGCSTRNNGLGTNLYGTDGTYYDTSYTDGTAYGTDGYYYNNLYGTTRGYTAYGDGGAVTNNAGMGTEEGYENDYYGLNNYNQKYTGYNTTTTTPYSMTANY